MRSSYKKMAVDPAFHRKLKKEAAEQGMKLIPYTKKLAEDCRSLDEKWNDKKKKRFNLGL